MEVKTTIYNLGLYTENGQKDTAIIIKEQKDSLEGSGQMGD